ncbi:MAG: hypothetical protein CMI60_22590 [Parvibaculum sp.]|nr:hypothetical protein [Parvibaculum sp.]
MATKNEVAKKKEQGITIFDPSIFEEDAGKGLENVGQEDLALPFVKVLSGNDPVLDENEDARKGDIYNTVTGKVYKGKTGIRVVPCAYQRRFIQWTPRGSGSGAPSAIYTPQEQRPKTERSADDNKDYVVGGNGEYIEETHQHFVLILNEDGSIETALIAMKSTQLKKSRKWNSIMASRVMQGQNGTFTPPRYSHIYHLKTIQEENSKGSWHGWEMSLESPIEDAALYGQAKKFSQDIMQGDVVVKHDNGEGETNGDSIPF